MRSESETPIDDQAFTIPVADRVKRLPPYLFGKINKLKYEKRVAGGDGIDLGMGNPTDAPDPLIQEKLKEALADPKNHRYSVSHGIENLRKEVAKRYWKRYGVRLDPDRDLAPGYCDPVQITERAWNDAAFFVDFTKDDSPRHFRLGVFSDLGFWNPSGRKWEEVPATERPLAIVERPPFGSDRWTHVAFTFEAINSDAREAVARFYLDGKPAGEIKGRRQVFTWDPAKARILLGLAYVGLFDDLAVFDRSLTAEEIQTILRLDQGIRSLRD